MCYTGVCPHEGYMGDCNRKQGAICWADAEAVSCLTCGNNLDWTIQPEEAYEASPCHACRACSQWVRKED